MNMFTTQRRQVRKVIQAYKSKGLKGVYKIGRGFIRRKLGIAQNIQWPVDKNDFIKVDSNTISKQATTKPLRKKAPPYIINWVIPPLNNAGGGGHVNIMRFVEYLESRGHTCRIYNYDPQNTATLSEIKKVIGEHFPKVKAEIFHGTDNILACDAIFATSWETAYPVYSFNGAKKKFYFVQDFEPFFFPVGTQSIMAENTYKFGFYGITAGKWLSTKLSQEYGMMADHYDFGADPKLYSYKNSGTRKRILFYARPITARRGFELGVAALEIFHDMHPALEIDFIGWNTSNFNIPFKHRSLGSKSVKQLNEIYNQTAAALVLSFTNMSLLPLELLASGCIPVVNDAKNNRLVSNNKYIKYTEPFPKDIAQALSEIVSQKNLPFLSEKAANSVKKLGWATAGEKVDKILTRELNG